MKKHICIKCNEVIFEEQDNYERTIELKGICWKCGMNPSERAIFFENVHNESENWRFKKTKEILNKKNPTDFEKHMMKVWAKK